MSQCGQGTKKKDLNSMLGYSFTRLPINPPPLSGSRHIWNVVQVGNVFSLHFNGHFPGEPGLAGVY